MKNIILIGYMGTGKSTVALSLSQYFNMQVAEMDAMIELQEGMSIPEIFEKKGEAAFRQIETTLLHTLQSMDNLIISCGGGVPMREENVTEMRKNGTVFLLTASPVIIYRRVRKNTNRPLLNGHMSVEYIQNMMKKRQPHYEAAADYIIETGNRSIEQITKEIAEKLSD